MTNTFRILVLGCMCLFGFQGANAQDDVSGRFVGEVYETGIGNYLAFIEISDGSQSGAFEYLNFPCGGTLSYVFDDGFSYHFKETLTFGAGMCLEGRTVRLTTQGGNEIYFEQMNGDERTIWGTLYRLHAGTDQ